MLNDIVGINFPDPEVREGLLRFVREGGGLGGLHGTSYGARDWPEFMEMLGAGEGPHRVQPGTWKIDDPNSPLTKTFAGQPFTYTDEYYRWYETGYYAQFYSRAKAHVLISIDMEHSPGFNDGRPPHLRRDNDYAISWIKGYGKGRVFNCDLGHMTDMFMQPKINEHILAATQFLLGDLPADTTPSAEYAGEQVGSRFARPLPDGRGSEAVRERFLFVRRQEYEEWNADSRSDRRGRRSFWSCSRGAFGIGVGALGVVLGDVPHGRG